MISIFQRLSIPDLRAAGTQAGYRLGFAPTAQQIIDFRNGMDAIFKHADSRYQTTAEDTNAMTKMNQFVAYKK